MGGVCEKAYAIGDGILHAVRGGVDDGKEMVVVVVLRAAGVMMLSGSKVVERMVVVVGWRWCGEGGDDDGVDHLGGDGWPKSGQKRWEAPENEKLECVCA
nr:hypothetical protein [Tanacetum cinerariifolium]